MMIFGLKYSKNNDLLVMSKFHLCLIMFSEMHFNLPIMLSSSTQPLIFMNAKLCRYNRLICVGVRNPFQQVHTHNIIIIIMEFGLKPRKEVAGSMANLLFPQYLLAITL